MATEVLTVSIFADGGWSNKTFGVAADSDIAPPDDDAASYIQCSTLLDPEDGLQVDNDPCASVGAGDTINSITFRFRLKSSPGLLVPYTTNIIIGDVNGQYNTTIQYTGAWATYDIVRTVDGGGNPWQYSDISGASGISIFVGSTDSESQLISTVSMIVDYTPSGGGGGGSMLHQVPMTGLGML